MYTWHAHGCSGNLRGIAQRVPFHPSSWLTITKEAYTSGAPKVKLKATENMQTTKRSAYVVFVAAKDTLALTINQAVYQSGTDVNNPNDTSTDQPAYSRSE